MAGPAALHTEPGVWPHLREKGAASFSCQGAFEHHLEATREIRALLAVESLHSLAPALLRLIQQPPYTLEDKARSWSFLWAALPGAPAGL